MKELLKQLERQGWRIVHNKHIKAYPPDKDRGFITISSTSSDVNVKSMVLRDIRRMGYEVDMQTGQVKLSTEKGLTKKVI